VIVKDPAAGTTFLIVAVESFDRTTAKTSDVVETNELVTTSDVAAAAKFTVPDILLIVWAPVVPPAVTVVGYEINPVDAIVIMLTSVFSDDPETPASATCKVIEPPRPVPVPRPPAIVIEPPDMFVPDPPVPLTTHVVGVAFVTPFPK
jgi:hypothetical protein